MWVLRWVFPQEVSYETLVSQTLTCEFLRKSRAETLVLET